MAPRSSRRLQVGVGAARLLLRSSCLHESHRRLQRRRRPSRRLLLPRHRRMLSRRQHHRSAPGFGLRLSARAPRRLLLRHPIDPGHPLPYHLGTLWTCATCTLTTWMTTTRRRRRRRRRRRIRPAQPTGEMKARPSAATVPMELPIGSRVVLRNRAGNKIAARSAAVLCCGCVERMLHSRFARSPRQSCRDRFNIFVQLCSEKIGSMKCAALIISSKIAGLPNSAGGRPAQRRRQRASPDAHRRCRQAPPCPTIFASSCALQYPHAVHAVALLAARWQAEHTQSDSSCHAESSTTRRPRNPASQSADRKPRRGACGCGALHAQPVSQHQLLLTPSALPLDMPRRLQYACVRRRRSWASPPLPSMWLPMLARLISRRRTSSKWCHPTWTRRRSWRWH